MMERVGRTRWWDPAEWEVGPRPVGNPVRGISGAQGASGLGEGWARPCMSWGGTVVLGLLGLLHSRYPICTMTATGKAGMGVVKQANHMGTLLKDCQNL